MGEKTMVPDIVKRFDREGHFERIPVKGWVHCGSCWKRSRIFDVLYFPDGTAAMEVKTGRQYVLLPFGTYDLSKLI